jgi:hypothetical protein
MQSTAFDTIYHEHVHYHSIQALSRALNKKGFSIFKIERNSYMCGSIRVYTCVGGENSPLINSMIEVENKFGLFQPCSWEKFMSRVRNVKVTVLSHLAIIREKKGKIIAIGAATKGNTFLNYCRLDVDTIAYITDVSLLKIGKLTPGSHIPIISDSDIDPTTTHALILPWNIASMLKDKLSHLGLQFYVPQVETFTTITNEHN